MPPPVYKVCKPGAANAWAGAMGLQKICAVQSATFRCLCKTFNPSKLWQNRWNTIYVPRVIYKTGALDAGLTGR